MRVVFMGSPDFAVPPLHALLAHHQVVLVVTQPDKPAGRGKRLAAPAVKQVAEAAGVPVVQPPSARAPEVAAMLRASGAEIGVVVAYGKILPLAVLEAFPRGCINVHGSLLPKYRGAAPIQWAIIEGQPQTGVTIMQLDEGMDTGPMLLRRPMPIAPDDTAGSVFARMAPLGAKALLEAIAAMERGALSPQPQDEREASHAPMLSKRDGIIDWRQPAIAVRDRIRGVDPWPGAITTLENQPLKLFHPSLEPGSGEPGVLLAVDQQGAHVACGDGVCIIGEVQAAGKKRTDARSFFAGRQVALGTKLGSP